MRQWCPESTWSPWRCPVILTILSVWEGTGLSIHLWLTVASGTHLLLPHPDGAELTVGLFEAMTLSCCPALSFCRASWPPQDSPHERSLGPHSTPDPKPLLKWWCFPRIPPGLTPPSPQPAQPSSSSSLSGSALLVGGVGCSYSLRMFFP